MSRAKEFEAIRDAHNAVAEILEACQNDLDGMIYRDINTGQRRDPYAAYVMRREVRRIISEMTGRAMRAEKSMKISIAKTDTRKAG